MKGIILAFGLIGLASANSTNEWFRIAAGIKNEPVLTKSAQEENTVYSNSSFDFHYTAPSGWSFTTSQIFTGTTGALIEYTAVPGYPSLGGLTVGGYSRTTATEADYLNYDANFSDFKIAYEDSKINSPTIYNIQDTTVGGVHYVASLIKNIDDADILVTYTASSSVYMLFFQYVTTIADYNVNYNVYFQHWLNLGFGTTVSTKASVTFKPQKFEFLPVNVLGEKITPKGVGIPAIRIPK